MKKKALILCGGYEGHEPVKMSAIVAADLQAAGLEVEIATNLAVLLDGARLRTFDLIVPNWTMGELTGDQESHFIEAIESGVGLAGFHGGMGDAFRAQTRYQFMVGGQFVLHPDNIIDYTVDIVKKDDPIVAGLHDFKVHSEQYYLHVDPANEVLATTTFRPVSAPWVHGTVMPVVWKRPYGAGRVFYSSIGHAPADLDIPEVREITRRGMLWAAR